MPMGILLTRVSNGIALINDTARFNLFEKFGEKGRACVNDSGSHRKKLQISIKIAISDI